MKIWFSRAALLLGTTAAAAGGSALLVLGAPTLPAWGERHLPHLHKPPLLLSSGHALEQTFVWERDILNRIVLWIDRTEPLPADGGIRIEVETAHARSASVVPFADIPPSGATVFPFDPPLRVTAGASGVLRISLTRPGQRVPIRYQIASGIYAAGSLRRDGREAQGDIAFQLRYRRPALGARSLHVGAALALGVAGLVLAIALQHPPEGRKPLASRRDWVLATLAGIAAASFYGWHLLASGIWVGPTDFSKDASYLASAADAMRAGVWPTWSHRTCGGMALLGNPEGNTITLGTVFATALSPDRALLILLTVEAGLAATGTVLLARSLSFSPTASVAAALVAILSASLPYRIIEGLTPVGGAVAFLPWALLFLLRAFETPRWRRFGGRPAVLAGSAFAFMFLRGDVHVVVGALGVAAALALTITAQRRTLQPLAVLTAVGAIFFLWSSIKILPYLEQPKLIARDLPPYVVPLIREGLLDDALLKVHDRTVTWKPLHDRRHETWGNFGAYVGVLPLLLAGVGVLTRHRIRWALVVGAVIAFLLSEGTLFENVLRHADPLGSLLRVPTRLFSMFALFLGLLAGLGLDRLRRLVPTRGGAIAALGVLAFLALDLGRATNRVFAGNLLWNGEPPVLSPDGPTITTHANSPAESPRHATKLLRAGFLLGKICGDQNSPPAFIQELREPLPLATVPSALAPNTIRLSAPAGPTDITVRERFTSSWSASHGDILERDDGSLHVLLPKQPAQTVTLTYRSATARAQQLMFATMMTVLLFIARSERQRATKQPPP